MADPDTLALLLDRLVRTPSLLEKSERFNLFDKLVLAAFPNGWKLRLHIFSGLVYEAHSHRASFGAIVLHGQYQHVLFGGACAQTELSQGTVPAPHFTQRQTPGAFYFISYEMVHATLAENMTISIMLQAPAEEESFEIIDLVSGETHRRLGGGTKSQEPCETKVSAAAVAEHATVLVQLGLATRSIAGTRDASA